MSPVLNKTDPYNCELSACEEQFRRCRQSLDGGRVKHAADVQLDYIVRRRRRHRLQVCLSWMQPAGQDDRLTAVVQAAILHATINR